MVYIQTCDFKYVQLGHTIQGLGVKELTQIWRRTLWILMDTCNVRRKTFHIFTTHKRQVFIDAVFLHVCTRLLNNSCIGFLYYLFTHMNYNTRLSELKEKHRKLCPSIVDGHSIQMTASATETMPMQTYKSCTYKWTYRLHI